MTRGPLYYPQVFCSWTNQRPVWTLSRPTVWWRPCPRWRKTPERFWCPSISPGTYRFPVQYVQACHVTQTKSQTGKLATETTSLEWLMSTCLTSCCRSDIFELFDLVMILSRGRMVYFGKATEMVPYFTSIGYPCPSLTNPCDYYGAYLFFVTPKLLTFWLILNCGQNVFKS